jgi:hypothetical protein
MTAAEGKGMTTLARRGQGDQTRRKERMRAGEVEGGRCKTQTNIEKEFNSNIIYSNVINMNTYAHQHMTVVSVETVVEYKRRQDL